MLIKCSALLLALVRFRSVVGVGSVFWIYKKEVIDIKQSQTKHGLCSILYLTRKKNMRIFRSVQQLR